MGKNGSNPFIAASKGGHLKVAPRATQFSAKFRRNQKSFTIVAPEVRAPRN